MSDTTVYLVQPHPTLVEGVAYPQRTTGIYIADCCDESAIIFRGLYGRNKMAKTTATYWNPLSTEHADQWTVVDGSEGMMTQLTLAKDETTGDYTRLTQFKAGANTSDFGAQVHDYPEEIYVISGRLYDQAFDLWLEAGCYASRPPGEVHGPFIAETDCLVLECSYPNQSIG